MAASITSITPLGGPSTGGTSVTITGTGFTGSTGVTFGGVAGTGFVVDSDTQISVVSPAHAVGAVDVIVANPGGDGTSVNGYTYQPTTVTVPVSGTGWPGATVHVELDNVEVTTATVDTGGHWSTTIQAGSGAHTIRARQTKLDLTSPYSTLVHVTGVTI